MKLIGQTESFIVIADFFFSKNEKIYSCMMYKYVDKICKKSMVSFTTCVLHTYVNF